MENKGVNMKKINTVEEKMSFTYIIGALFVGFAFIDFVMSWTGNNLTYFLGPVSAFSPLIFGGIGYTLMNIGEN